MQLVVNSIESFMPSCLGNTVIIIVIVPTTSRLVIFDNMSINLSMGHTDYWYANDKLMITNPYIYSYELTQLVVHPVLYRLDLSLGRADLADSSASLEYLLGQDVTYILVSFLGGLFEGSFDLLFLSLNSWCHTIACMSEVTQVTAIINKKKRISPRTSNKSLNQIIALKSYSLLCVKGITFQEY